MSDWIHRVDTRSGDSAHGITFHMWERAGDNVRGEFSSGPQKMLVDGRASLTLATNQYKYGNEVIAQLYTREQPRIHTRHNDDWTRTQIYLGPADLNTAQILEDMARRIREHHVLSE